MTPKEFLKFRQHREKSIDRIQSEIDVAERAAMRCKLPKGLRPATAEDIVEDAIIWYPRWEEAKWCIIRDVHFPDDDFKAFTAEDGCRYGLEGAFVEDVPKRNRR